MLGHTFSSTMSFLKPAREYSGWMTQCLTRIFCWLRSWLLMLWAPRITVTLMFLPGNTTMFQLHWPQEHSPHCRWLEGGGGGINLPRE